MASRWKMWSTLGLAVLVVSSAVGYSTWYQLTMDEWRAEHIRPLASPAKLSPDAGPGTSGVSRGGQPLPAGLYLGLPLLILLIVPILLALWWRPWRSRPVDEGRPPWLADSRRLASPARAHGIGATRL